MFFLPLSFLLLLLFILLLPFVFLFISIGVVGAAFTKLGLSPQIALLIFFLCLLGSIINIPVAQRAGRQKWRFSLFPSSQAHQVIYVNLGGAIIPILLCIYLLPRTPLLATLLATSIMIILAKIFTRPVSGVGLALPLFIPPLAAASLALILAHRNPAPVAYISGVLGSLIGADILNFSKLRALRAPRVSIGGAGVFDGIFLVGIISAFLTF